jgi:hypothetical protein
MADAWRSRNPARRMPFHAVTSRGQRSEVGGQKLREKLIRQNAHIKCLERDLQKLSTLIDQKISDAVEIRRKARVLLPMGS